MNSLISNRRILTCFVVFALLLLSYPAAVYGGTWEVPGTPSATITKTHTDEGVTFTVVITTAGAHYGVGMAFATSTEHPAFQVWYREYQDPKGFYYQEYTGTEYCGWGGEVVPLSQMSGFSGEGSFDTNTFTITVPWSALGGCGNPYYFAIQFRTTVINSHPQGWGWCSPVSAYASQDLPACPIASIDIKPGSLPNSVNTKAKGVLPVAILSSVDFDVTQVDPTLVSLLGANPEKWSLEDINGDGQLDLILHFRIEDLDFTGLDMGEHEVSLTGTYLGHPFSGTDIIRIVK